MMFRRARLQKAFDTKRKAKLARASRTMALREVFKNEFNF